MKRLILKVIIIILCITISIIIFLKTERIIIGDYKKTNRIELYENVMPIDLTTGTINNLYFGISSDGTNGIETIRGLNSAIQYAYDNKINNIKLEKGNYLITSEFNDNYQQGLVLKSNINLDLNGSKIFLIANDKTSYRLLSLMNLNNVSISNGIIIGDRDEHDYSVESTHEWGMGIDIRGSNNIMIYNMEIYNTIGDGIYISDLNDVNTYDIWINNCNIHDCRRQGISIIAGDNIRIYNNEIHHINGTKPQTGIDLERNLDTQIVNDIYILNNKFYREESNIGIAIYNDVENVYIENNELYGIIKNNIKKDTIYIGTNIYKDEKDVSIIGTDNNITNLFKDINFKNVIYEMIGKNNTEPILESDIAKIASDNVAGGKQLNLSNKGIKDLSGIEIFAKYNLEWLYIDNNEITDLTPLSTITSLTKLNASNNKIQDLSPIQGLVNLETMNLTNNELIDISVLSNFNNLKYLYLKNNKINSLNSLINNVTLKELYCAENEIETVDNILKIESLEKFDVRKNKIKSIINSPINLKYLDISENNVSDISSLIVKKIDYFYYSKQYLEYSSLQKLGSKYVKVDLPQIFSMYGSDYDMKVIGISDYEFKDNYVMVLADEFNNNGFTINVLKDNVVFLSYKMNIDNSIIEAVSKVFTVQKISDEFLVSGIELENKKIEDFMNSYKFDDIYTISFFRNNESLDITNFVSTGSIMRVYDTKKEIYQDFTLVIYGDVNGDGNISSRDALSIISNKLGEEGELTGSFLQAARITNETKSENLMPSALDALAIIKHKLKLEYIMQNNNIDN